MDAIVLKALVKDPDYRYQSADEMRADIEACLDGQPVAATAAMGSVGYGGYPDDQPTTALRSTDAQATSMLPPMNPDDGGYGYDDRPDRRRQKKSNTSTILLVVAAVLVLVGAILIGKWAFGGGATDKPFEAPNFVNQTLTDAKRMAKNVDLNVSVTRKPCEDQKTGNVCSQDPKAGVNVNKGDTVTLVVSTGAPKVAVPDVKGLTFDKAKSELEDKGFVVEKETKESDQTAGVVIAQDPGGDTEKEKGTTITLTVAVEKKQSVVPDVSGKTCDEATAQMTANNLVGQCTEVETDDANLVGKVIQTSPQANAPADPGSKVSIQIGKAKTQTAVPNVVTQTVKQARQTLQQSGFTNITFANGSDQSDNAIVMAQDPQQGTQADPASTTITLTTVSANGNNGGNNGGNIFGGATG
jgi:serine/threonine-protein kinase